MDPRSRPSARSMSFANRRAKTGVPWLPQTLLQLLRQHGTPIFNRCTSAACVTGGGEARVLAFERGGHGERARVHGPRPKEVGRGGTRGQKPGRFRGGPRAPPHLSAKRRPKRIRHASSPASVPRKKFEEELSPV